MTRVPIFTVEAFNIGDNEPYTGNPAAVCILEFDDDIPDEEKQKIANTMNLSETAFVAYDWKRSEPKLQRGHTDPDPTILKRTLRWFTPTSEVSLCGHATVGSARTLLTLDKEGSVEKIEFESKFRGLLTASYDKSRDMIVLDFPANPTEQIPLNSEWLPEFTRLTLGPHFNGKNPMNDLMDVHYTKNELILVLRLKKRMGETPEETIKKVKPNFESLLEAKTGDITVQCQIVTIEGDTMGDSRNINFYSRFFARAFGIDEDSVTGLGHTILTPYWTKELQLEGGKTMMARQASSRGGDVSCLLEGDRVRLDGRARVVLQGHLNL